MGHTVATWARLSSEGSRWAKVRLAVPSTVLTYAAKHPRPDLGAAFALEDPVARVSAVLAGTYGWYRETEPMLGKLHDDRSSVPALDEYDPAAAELMSRAVTAI